LTKNRRARTSLFGTGNHLEIISLSRAVARTEHKGSPVAMELRQ
jgi:hypothetical protein